MTPIFYEVATLDTANDPPFAVIRIDTDKRIESGCEGVVVHTYWSRPEAEAAAKLARTEHAGLPS